MVKVAKCQNKQEARVVERQLIQKWKPNINEGDKPFWLLKKTYANDLRERKRQQERPRAPPWQKTGKEECREHKPVQAFTTYEVVEDGGVQMMATNLQNIVKERMNCSLQEASELDWGPETGTRGTGTGGTGHPDWTGWTAKKA